jgi:Prp8 binding protein
MFCIRLKYIHEFYSLKNLLRVAWSPNGEKLSAGSADKFVYVWDLNTKKILYKLPGHLGSVNEVDFHPNEPISE